MTQPTPTEQLHVHERGRFVERDYFGVSWFHCSDEDCYVVHSEPWWDGWEARAISDARKP